MPKLVEDLKVKIGSVREAELTKIEELLSEKIKKDEIEIELNKDMLHLIKMKIAKEKQNFK